MDFDFLAVKNEMVSKNQMDREDEWDISLDFSRIVSDTITGMDLECINSDIQLESLSYSPIKKAESHSSENHSKDSLKFARRISKSFLHFIKQDTDPMLRAFLDCGSQLLTSQAANVGVKIFDNKKLIKDSLQLIGDVWTFFSKNLSCSYNRKISKVTKEIWNMVFTEEGFWKTANEVGVALQLKDYFSECTEVEAEVIRVYFKKVLFMINRGLILVHLYLKKIGKYDFYQNISRYENYLVLSMVPQLFDSYNHKRGVFVDECCRACKVCQPKLADGSSTLKIKTAWEYAIAFEQSFRSNYSLQNFQDPVNSLIVLQFLAELDDAVERFSQRSYLSDIQSLIYFNPSIGSAQEGKLQA